MIKELVCDDAVLSTPCEAATADDAELAQDLIDTMNANGDAVCLAANQIGVTKSVVVYKGEDEKDHVLYNPRLLMGLGPQKLVESCMTHEGETRVTRFIKAKVAYDELVDGQLKPRKKDFLGWEAQMVQHMIDHCKGKLV
ncbi:peptide deformylase [Paratractidigestivibacter sp.]|uniref:peptide deformylase n=1 Tax=Paratractidigestivibacter sp. TaxID=2847316 RepID=UPI002ABE884B|nr:peptide deformylase [Paratractidigestivibacter sp.]